MPHYRKLRTKHGAFAIHWIEYSRNKTIITHSFPVIHLFSFHTKRNHLTRFKKSYANHFYWTAQFSVYYSIFHKSWHINWCSHMWFHWIEQSPTQYVHRKTDGAVRCFKLREAFHILYMNTKCFSYIIVMTICANKHFLTSNTDNST